MFSEIALENGHGFSFGGEHSKDYRVIVLKSSIPVLSNTSHRLETLGGRGVYYARSSKSEGVIPLSCSLLVKGETAQREYAEMLSAWLNPLKGLQDLVLDTRPDRKYAAICDGTFDIKKAATVGLFDLSFICPTPIGYSLSEETMVSSNNVIEGLNNGSAETPLTIKYVFSGAASSFKITEQSTGDFIEVTHEFKSGDVLELDTGVGKVQVNGVVRMDLLSFVSDWFDIPPGNFKLTVDSGASGTLEIRFVEGWWL